MLRYDKKITAIRLACAWTAAACIVSPAIGGELDAAFRGRWTIASSAMAPWATATDSVFPKEVAALVGRTVDIRADGIRGPTELACRKPNYELRAVPADELFQGTLADDGDLAEAPEVIAARLGFTGKTPTLITGCANEIEFHRRDDGSLAFGLNNSIYRLTRSK